MRAKRHPLSGAVYDARDDGLVQVTDDGVSGLFTARGVWVEGELRAADPELCWWIGGPQVREATSERDRLRSGSREEGSSNQGLEWEESQ